MAIDEEFVALPQLYGAPAYARPAPVVVAAEKPFDPDDLPIEAYQTPEERDLALTLPAQLYEPVGAHASGQGAAYPAQSDDATPRLRPRQLSLKALAGRIRGNES